MARYVLSHRRAGLFRDDEKRAAREDAHRAFSTLLEPVADVVAVQSPLEDTRREIVIFDASPTEVAARRDELGADVLLEKEILHFPVTTLPLDLATADPSSSAGTVPSGTGVTMRVTVRGTSGPLTSAEALLFLRSAGGETTSSTTRTDGDGVAGFEYAANWSPAAMVVVPAGGHWTMVVRGPVDGMTVDAPELPATGPRAWWHELFGVGDGASGAGDGVRVGVADTGVGPHAHLQHVVDSGAFIEGRHLDDPDAGQDVDAHGTHVCGTIGARPPAGARYAGGVAPGAELFSARVFPSADSGANQGDIAAAIDHLSADRAADLVNLSLGAARPSSIEQDAIIDALERGTLCVCAAANSAGPVEYPAAFPESVAVSALGLEGWGPAGSLSSTRYPDAPDRFGDDGLYLANFSCFGPEIECAGPGVGVIATVPERFGLTEPYAGMDGTSMASPAACGMLAVMLAASPEYLALPRNVTRSAQARALLRACCRDVGLAASFQGRGVPSRGESVAAH